ncbi:diguanylate cyclase [Vallitalea sp.]|uniref:diguanylate cyclase n=1 Tax=Vallitalea sp. TaxID=1882829 RepID=UPI002600A614|nr:diguanylate cyclase [Vallitalea sp.]MCT4685778.1 diguanylate cyclase [Vallitalea sp.]
MKKQSVYFRLVNKLSLRTIIVIPVFLILLLGSSLIYYQIETFFIKYSAKVIETNQVRIKNHVYDHLDDYFEIPVMVNKYNAILVKNKQLNLQDEQLLGRILLNEVKSNTAIDYAYFANSDGGIVSSGLYQGTNRISYTKDMKAGEFRIYEADEDGNILNYIKSVEFDSRKKPWYIEANQDGIPYWTGVYSGAQEPILGMSTSYPVISPSGVKIGVFGTDILLDQLSKFLKTIEITKNSVVCLVDEKGLIVASSTSEKPFKDINGSQVRLAAVESKNTVIREGYNRVITKYNHYFNEEIKDRIKVRGEDYYYCFSKYSYNDKINWNLMISIPRDDLIGDIEMLFLKFSIIFFAVVILILIAYTIISRWIMQPIESLNSKVNQMTNDNWGIQIETNRRDELGQLTRSFNSMSIKLRDYILMLNNKQEELEEINTTLEELVHERTKELELLTITDSLTNIYNKRYLMEKLNQNIEKAKRYNETFSIVIFDIDHFKKVNDTYGHLEGDVTLREVSNFLASTVRDVDVLGRYGGEEFMIIMTSTKLDEAYIAADRARDKLSKLIIGSKNIKITISGGVAEYRTDDSLLDIIKRADNNLYIAKKSGRNKIIK